MFHYEASFNPRKAFIRVENNRVPNLDTPISQIDSPVICLQCEPAPCAESCPEEAFERDLKSGAWKIQHELCTGCGCCRDQCPNNMIRLEDDKAVKCDLCEGNPICVRFCPTGALVLE
jgi:Fe-S-cluster-containing hydrogenase component 2